VLVDEVIAAFRERFDVRLEMLETVREDIRFKLPRALEP
jgi:4-hydroxy-3-methylbut-2-enyl diphosphate reductase